MNINCYSGSTGIWLVGKRVHDRLWELTNLTKSENQTDTCLQCAVQASQLTEYLTARDIRLFFRWDTFLETFDHMYHADRVNTPVLIVDADMLGERRLELLHLYKRESSKLVIVVYMATDHASLAMQMDDLNFSGYVTKQDAGYQWIHLFDALSHTEPYYTTGWRNLFRQDSLMFADDKSFIYPMADWVGPPSDYLASRPEGQKVDFSINKGA